MRVTYRTRFVKEYWEKRWQDIPADQPMENTKVYPLKYALESVKSREDLILEAGCGAGRILRYFHNNGFRILGIDYIESAILKLRSADQTLNVQTGDIQHLQFPDDTFDCVLAFGLYHSLPAGEPLEAALSETRRVLKPNGRLCASFRSDNIQNRFGDFLADLKSPKKRLHSQPKEFHKLNFTKSEFEALIQASGFLVDKCECVENMPFLYKFSVFRSNESKIFNESLGRIDGYKLNPIGQRLQKALIRFFPAQFCNVYLIQARNVQR